MNETKPYKFTIPKQGYYQYALTLDDVTYTQTVLADSLADAQAKLTADGWERL